MAFPFGRSSSVKTAESDTLAEFMETVEQLWPGATIQPPTPRTADLIRRHDEWLNRKFTNGISWFDIITQSMDETSNDDRTDQYIYDADTDDAT
jgi:hypothetical protein